MIWIIGEYAERIDNADELLESFLESFPEEPPQVQLQLLTATVKLFLKKPTEGPQQMIQVSHLHSSCIFSVSYLFWLYHICMCKFFTNGCFLLLDIFYFYQKSLSDFFCAYRGMQIAGSMLSAIVVVGCEILEFLKNSFYQCASGERLGFQKKKI